MNQKPESGITGGENQLRWRRFLPSAGRTPRLWRAIGWYAMCSKPLNTPRSLLVVQPTSLLHGLEPAPNAPLADHKASNTGCAKASQPTSRLVPRRCEAGTCRWCSASHLWGGERGRGSAVCVVACSDQLSGSLASSLHLCPTGASATGGSNHQKGPTRCQRSATLHIRPPSAPLYGPQCPAGDV